MRATILRFGILLLLPCTMAVGANAQQPDANKAFPDAKVELRIGLMKGGIPIMWELAETEQPPLAWARGLLSSRL